MTQRTERIAHQIRAVIGEALARQELKDPRVRDAGLITITHVKVTGDHRTARVYFMAHGADDRALEKVRTGLEQASGFLRRMVGRSLRMKVTPELQFEVDRVFEQAEKVEQALRDVSGPGRGDAGPEGEGEP